MAFIHNVETLLSLGLSLTIHQNVMIKTLVSVLTSVYLGTAYERILNIEKRVVYAVMSRMKTTKSFCFPDFAKKGLTTFFVTENIDMLEDTALGQNTLHGIIVVYQEEEDEAEPINESLLTPAKALIKPLQINTNYLDGLIITPKAFKFETCFW